MSNNWKPCKALQLHLKDQRIPLQYDAKLREFYIPLLDRLSGRGSAIQLINYCPFCGSRFPTSLRDMYFDELDNLGIDIGNSDYCQNLPDDFKSDKWWRDKGL
jgi:hypothetical protein